MKNILLVEDDPFLIDIYTTKLREESFSIEVATDGKEGLKKLREKKFDLLVLDIVLPKIDGWEILEKLKTELPKEAKVKMRTKFSSPITKIISAWRYPARSPIGELPPIPEDILWEINEPRNSS